MAGFSATTSTASFKHNANCLMLVPYFDELSNPDRLG